MNMRFVSVKLCLVKLMGVAERQRHCYLECKKVMVKSAPGNGEDPIFDFTEAGDPN